MRTLVTATLLLSATSLLAQDASPSHAFDYDSKASLNVQEAGVEHARRVIRALIVRREAEQPEMTVMKPPFSVLMSHKVEARKRSR